jgi:hypothetical protein
MCTQLVGQARVADVVAQLAGFLSPSMRWVGGVNEGRFYHLPTAVRPSAREGRKGVLCTAVVESVVRETDAVDPFL